jgi:hypothetical protein
MAGPYDLTGQNIENTYQRVIQTHDGTTFYDGTGSLVILPSANTSSLLTTASVNLNTITFTKGDGSTFPITVDTGSGGTIAVSGSNVTQSFNNAATWIFNHNLGTRVPIITVFDTDYKQIIPQDIELININSATITFPTTESGFAIASLGGAINNVVSSSYASTASYYVETDPVFTAKSASLATTGSNTFRGNQTVTGSLFTSGSNTLIGSTTLTGSLNITGSTTQTGNNTLTGTTTLTGSINMSGDIIPTASSSFDLGSETNPWRSIYVQSGSISIQSDIPGGIPAVISNANGNVTIAGAGLQLKSGSFIPFEVNSAARTIIRVPNLPANDIGGLSIIGSSTGVYQDVTNAGGLLHLTSNDGASSRITSDAFGTAAVVVYAGRKARGTAASPLPVQSGDTLTRISTVGWTGPEYGFTMSASAVLAVTAIETVALENFTTSSFGTRYNFYNAPLGGTIRTLSAQIDTTGITIPSTSRFFGTASWALNTLTASFSQTASYVNPLRQDVIITGSLKVSGSLTEIGDTVLTGSLTLSSGSALNINDGFYVNGNKQFNYGAFCSTGSQTNPVANVSRSMQLDTTEHSAGISIVAGSRITFAHAGLYNIQFSAQLESTSAGDKTVNIWFKKNGSNVARSNTQINVAKQAGDKVVAAWNYVDSVNASDYIEIMWQATDTTMQLFAAAATGNTPATPSVILTVTQVA